jgi:hypothetical protein
MKVVHKQHCMNEICFVGSYRLRLLQTSPIDSPSPPSNKGGYNLGLEYIRSSDLDRLDAIHLYSTILIIITRYQYAVGLISISVCSGANLDISLQWG